MLLEEGLGGVVGGRLGKRGDGWVGREPVWHRIRTVVEPIAADRDVFGEGVVLAEKLLDDVGESRRDNQ